MKKCDVRRRSLLSCGATLLKKETGATGKEARNRLAGPKKRTQPLRLVPKKPCSGTALTRAREAAPRQMIAKGDDRGCLVIDSPEGRWKRSGAAFQTGGNPKGDTRGGKKKFIRETRPRGCRSANFLRDFREQGRR